MSKISYLEPSLMHSTLPAGSVPYQYQLSDLLSAYYDTLATEFPILNTPINTYQLTDYANPKTAIRGRGKKDVGCRLYRQGQLIIP
jgi:hypothetical protein